MTWRTTSSTTATSARVGPPATKEFAAAAPAEVAAVDAWWDGDLYSALAEAIKVLEELGKNSKAARYAALWNYLAATWTLTLAREKGDPSGTLGRAADGTSRLRAHAGEAPLGSTTSPIAMMRSRPPIGTTTLTGSPPATFSGCCVPVAPKKQVELDKAALGLSQTQFKAYETGLRVLGTYAGASETYDSGGAQAAADATWIFQASAKSTIATGKVREANGHRRYVEARRRVSAPTGSFICFATPQTAIDHAAKAVCDDAVFHVASHTPVDLLARLKRALNAARRFGPTLDEAGVLAALKSDSCLPSQWYFGLTAQPLRSLGT